MKDVILTERHLHKAIQPHARTGFLASDFLVAKRDSQFLPLVHGNSIILYAKEINNLKSYKISKLRLDSVPIVRAMSPSSLFDAR
jgi:hypothetical protein